MLVQEAVTLVEGAAALEEEVEVELVPVEGFRLSNVSSSLIDPLSPRTTDHVRAVALITLSLLNP